MMKPNTETEGSARNMNTQETLCNLQRNLVWLLVSFVIIGLLSLTSVGLAGTWIDDFEDGNLNGWTVSGGGWSIQDGRLSGSFAGSGGNASVIYTGFSSWEDYTLEAKVCLLERLGGHPEMAFCARLNPTIWHTYSFCLHFVNNHAEIYRHRGWGGGGIQKLVSKPYQLSENTWYKVKYSVSGEHLSFYIDDELCAEVDESGLGSGKAGIYISSVHVLIDDIAITGDDIPDNRLFQAVKPQSKLVTSWGNIKLQ